MELRSPPCDLSAFVEIEGSLLSDGSVVATEIDMTDGAGGAREAAFTDS
jgi:hypothetical protein